MPVQLSKQQPQPPVKRRQPMRKPLKLSLGVLAFLLAAAILVVGVVGLTTGWENITGKQVVTTREYTCSATGITLLQIDVGDRPVKVRTGDGDQIVIRYPTTQMEGLRIRNADAALRVDDSYTDNWMQWAFAWMRGGYERSLEITLPLSLRAAVRIQTTHGDVAWTGQSQVVSLYLRTYDSDAALSSLSASGNVTVGTTHGSLTLADVSGSAVAADNASGDITLQNVSARSIAAHTQNAPIKGDTLSAAETLSLSTTNAAIAATALVAMDTQLSTDRGDITGSLRGAPEQYTIRARTTGGSSNLPLEEVREAAQRTLTVCTTEASIDIAFLGD